MATIGQIREATIKARAATSMPGIGTRIDRGLIQVVNVSMNGRRTTVDELSGWVGGDAALSVLAQIAADKACR